MAPSLDVIHGAIGGTPFFDDILLLGGVHGTDCGKMIDMNEKTSVPQNQSWLQGAPPSPSPPLQLSYQINSWLYYSLKAWPALLFETNQT